MTVANTLETILEKQALKELVDTFANLADVKDVAAQGHLFTDDAKVVSHIKGQGTSEFIGKEAIVAGFSAFLANFNDVYHANGQFLVTDLTDTTAQATHYCQVALTSEQDGVAKMTKFYIRYEDQYVKVDNNWKIAQRTSHFLIVENYDLAV
ncbi:nuclear transport factor 2 family protein [Psittacicella hinzii]|uniref:SnoaL-like domain-containing protein n=1 Tax=Psittacicella hinzii TaxID=2028575 RepID=A0A3A1YSY7_9GAMM|nr:nuclear transport factor 2 family protein [Psittacicella hinzii]RIY40328.1 hypothetical protein CKF58_00755 [Psittacicella hinzii]